ncbi:unnamed protein product [Urochloa decumbens]|uniref:Uncharacterized protein n=1 Tax=Urochloa decumbens TaxID=240449 RepID=A0ABC9GM57_9POAL
MDPCHLDQSPGILFAEKVRLATGSLVASSHPDEIDNFWLIAAFSRSRIKLSESSVGGILQSCLGGSAKLFCVVELENQLYKFGVSSKSVGLLVFGLRSFACPSFKVFFHLWNERGVSLARSSALSDSGPHFDWVEGQNNNGNVNQNDEDMAEGEWGQWPNNQGGNGQENEVPIGPQPQQVPEGPALLLNDMAQPVVLALGVDLNQPLENDLGGIENMAPEIVAPAQPMVDVQAQVIDGGDPSEGSDQPALLPDLNEVNNVEVFIPMDNEIPLQVMPDEVQEEELMGSQDSQGQSSSSNQETDNNVMMQQDMQIGFVQLIQPEVDPVFTARLLHSQPPISKQHAAAVLQHEAERQLTNDSRTMAQHEVKKQILHDTKKGTEMDDRGNTGKGKMIVQEDLSLCITPEKWGQRISPSTGPWSKALLEQAAQQKNGGGLIDTDLRRSDRKKQALKGFKHHTCLDKECLGCSSKPPAISPSIIKNLGGTFCRIDPTKLTEEALGKKRKASAPGGKKLAIKKPNKPNEDDDPKIKKPNNKKQPKNLRQAHKLGLTAWA